MQVRNYCTIPFLGKWAMTHALVAQILEQGDTTAIFLCDNALDPSDEYPWDRSPRVMTYACPGWNIHRMWNFGILQACKYEFDVEISEHGADDPWPIPVVCNVGVFNNDLELVSPHYVGVLGEALRSDGSLAMVSGTEMDVVPPHLPYYYAHFESGVQGNSMMVKAELPFRFDERFEWWYGDNDFGAQCENAGYALAVVVGARHIHLGGGSATTNDLPPESLAKYHEGTMRDRERFHKKWPQIPVMTGALPRELLFKVEKYENH